MFITRLCIFFLLGWWFNAVFVTKSVGLVDWIVTAILLLVALVCGLIDKKK